MNIHCRKKKGIYLPNHILTMGGKPVPAISISETYKYLGAPVGAATTSRLKTREHRTTMLEALTKAPLKPPQRLYFVRNNVIPKTEHQLVLTNPRMKYLKQLDSLIRSYCRRGLFLKIKITALATRIPTLRYSRLAALGRMEDPLAYDLIRI